jgi:hypothetical protein
MQCEIEKKGCENAAEDQDCERDSDSINRVDA